jgi:predicted enzyme related to lactoylglutathione lyase
LFFKFVCYLKHIKTFVNSPFEPSPDTIDSNNQINYGLIKAEEGAIGGGIGAAPEGSSGHATFCVHVDDIQGCLDKVESLGGKNAHAA